MELRSLVPVNELWGLATEELEDLVSVLTIHFDFVEHSTENDHLYSWTGTQLFLYIIDVNLTFYA